MEEPRPARANVRLRTALEQLPNGGQRAGTLLGERAREAAGGFIGPRRSHDPVELRDVPSCVLKDEFERGDGFPGCDQRIGHRLRPTLKGEPARVAPSRTRAAPWERESMPSSRYVLLTSLHPYPHVAGG
jgi:hypothetical protein